VQRSAALVFFGVLVAAAIIGPLLAPYDPALPSGAPLQPPGAGHLLGTNDIGQDVWSGLLWGGRASLSVAAAVALLSTGLAWAVGISAGASRRLEGALMAVTDLLLALPAIPLLLLVVSLVRPSQLHLILALGLLSWPAFARVVRARVIGVRSEPYVEAARGLGGTPLHVALRHLAPATLELLPAKLVLTVRFAIFAEATLAFLGLGDASAPSWGTMLSWAFSNPLIFASAAWTWWVIPPALAIVATVLGTTWLAEGVLHSHHGLDWHGRHNDARSDNALHENRVAALAADADRVHAVEQVIQPQREPELGDARHNPTMLDPLRRVACGAGDQRLARIEHTDVVDALDRQPATDGSHEVALAGGSGVHEHV
jgi:ABC-type dipeptide/oligopeptide/nickel transport system permease subunit